jgi:hypothetical protein
MNRCTRILLAAALLVTVGMVTPNSAQAQIGFRIGYGVNLGPGPYSLYGPYPGWYGSIGVTLGGVGSGYQYNYFAIRPGGSSPFTGLPFLYTRSGGTGIAYPTNTGSRIMSEQRNAIAAAQRNAKWDRGMTAPVPNLDQWLNEQVQPKEAKELKTPPLLDPSLIQPSDESILNGDVLNELRALIGDRERAGKKAEPGLCAPELILKIVFEGGSAAEAANQFRHTELSFPPALQVMAFADLRSGLEAAYAPVAAAASAGKRVVAADAERLMKEIAKARKASGDLVKEACVDDATSVCRFFNRLESATKFIAEPAAAGVAGVKWSSVGITVEELLKHMAKYHLKFGKVAEGDEAAYYSLHRGLLAYYAGLSQTK